MRDRARSVPILAIAAVLVLVAVSLPHALEAVGVGSPVSAQSLAGDRASGAAMAAPPPKAQLRSGAANGKERVPQARRDLIGALVALVALVALGSAWMLSTERTGPAVGRVRPVLARLRAPPAAPAVLTAA